MVVDEASTGIATEPEKGIDQEQFTGSDIGDLPF
jgi:hypothetical protein